MYRALAVQVHVLGKNTESYVYRIESLNAKIHQGSGLANFDPVIIIFVGQKLRFNPKRPYIWLHYTVRYKLEKNVIAGAHNR